MRFVVSQGCGGSVVMPSLSSNEAESGRWTRSKTSLGVAAADETVGQAAGGVDRLGDEVEVTELALVVRDGVAGNLVVEQSLDLVVEGVAVRMQAQDLGIGQDALRSLRAGVVAAVDHAWSQGETE